MGFVSVEEVTTARDSRVATGAEIRFEVGACSLGVVLVARSARGVCAIGLGDDRDQLVRELHVAHPNAEWAVGDHDLDDYVAQVVRFIEAPGAGLHLPLDVRGTAFQQRVWRALIEIPLGATVTYTDIAERLGAPAAVRAVAQACAKNHIAIAIPCHRVVRRDRTLSGYRWGVDRKRQLLHREHLATDPATLQLTTPTHSR